MLKMPKGGLILGGLRGGVQAYNFEKHDFELGVVGEGPGKSQHFGGSFGSMRAMLPMWGLGAKNGTKN